MANLQWGVNQTTPTQTSGIINMQSFWKTRLTNEQLELLTGDSFYTYAEMASYYNYTLQ
jgi:hypothetical protein